MRVAASALCASVLLAACAGSDEPATRANETVRPVLAVTWIKDERAYLVRLDPRSLKPLPARRVPLEAHGALSAFSPDGSQVAFSGPSTVRIVDVGRMRAVRDVPLGARAAAIAWPHPRRLLVATGFKSEVAVDEAVVVDPVARQVVSRRALAGSLLDFAETPESLVLLLGRESAIGPARLVLLSVEGGVRTARLARVPAGFRTERVERGFSVDHFKTPGLAIDPQAGRAYVVSERDEVVAVDLESMSVTYHALRKEVSLLGRLRHWLEPTAEAKGASDGYHRRALWLGNGRLAISGSDDHAFFDEDGFQKQTTEPAGLALVDTKKWSKRMLEPQATGALLTGGDTLLAYGIRWNSELGVSEGAGLTAFTLEGERRFHVLGDEPLWTVQATGRYAYAGSDHACGAWAVELDSGRIPGELELGSTCDWPSLLVPKE